MRLWKRALKFFMRKEEVVVMPPLPKPVRYMSDEVAITHKESGNPPRDGSTDYGWITGLSG